MGVNYISLESNEAAIDSFDKCIRIEHNNYAAYLNLAICCHAERRYEDALNYIEQCLLLKPGLPEALSEKGKIKRFLGHYEEASKLLTRCLDKHPDNKTAKSELPLALLACGQPIGAALLVESLKTKVRELAVGKEILIIDVCFLDSFAYKLIKVDEYYVHVEFSGCVIQVAIPSANMIGVGLIPTDNGYKPVIMIKYEYQRHFQHHVDLVKSIPCNKNVRIISGTLTDKIDHCEVILDLDGRQLGGHTEKTEDPAYHKFIDNYKNTFTLLLMHDGFHPATFELQGLSIN